MLDFHDMLVYSASNNQQQASQIQDQAFGIILLFQSTYEAIFGRRMTDGSCQDESEDQSEDEDC
jgi:hypothetical protein